MIYCSTDRRNGHDDTNVRGYKEEGTVMMLFDMVVLNDMESLPPRDRRHRPCAGVGAHAALVRQSMLHAVRHVEHTWKYGEDMP